MGVLDYMVEYLHGELHGGSVGLYDRVLGYMVESVELHGGDCWVTWSIRLHGGVLDYMMGVLGSMVGSIGFT